MKNKFLFIISLIFLSILSANGDIKMVFRYDDYLLVSSKLNDSILYIFHKNNIPLCIGIIPFDDAKKFHNDLNEDQVRDLRSRIQRQEVEVALHGYNHNNNVKASFLTKNYSSEFATISYASQYEKLAKGKRSLDSLLQTETKLFIPPFNTYDNNTLKALENLQFDIISADMSGASANNEIQYIPGTFVDFVDLPKIIETNRVRGVTVILYFHPFSFTGGSPKYPNNFTKQITINQLDILLHWLKAQGVSFCTFSELAKTANFNKALYQVNAAKYNLLKKVLYKLKIYSYGIYPISGYQKQNREFLFGNFLLHLLSFLFVYFLVIYVCKILHPNFSIILILLAILTLSVLFYFYYHRVDFSFWILFIIFMVNYMALILGIFRVYKPWIYASKKKL
jgi:peptidoglycan/xylan/chitin deacetylase (PgdA/CDA1 family)